MVFAGAVWEETPRTRSSRYPKLPHRARPAWVKPAESEFQAASPPGTLRPVRIKPEVAIDSKIFMSMSQAVSPETARSGVRDAIQLAGHEPGNTDQQQRFIPCGRQLRAIRQP